MANRTVGPTGREFTTVQAAINAAVDGDVIVCDAGVSFRENLTMPLKALVTGITITTSASAGNLPGAGVRTNPSYAAFMPKLQSPGSGLPTVVFAPGAHHYTFRHLEFPEVPFGFNAIIKIGANDSTQQFYADEPHHITIDRCFIHGGLVCGQKRGVDCHGRYILLDGVYFDDIKSVGQDSQSISGANGHGPLTVTNCRLGGGTEPFIIGGADPVVRTFMTITGTPTATSASVTCSEAGHTLSELIIGQGISVQVGGKAVFSTIATISGSGASGSITFVSVGGTPDVGTVIKAGVVLGMEGPGFGLIFRRNLIEQNVLWREGNLPIPRGVGALGSTASGALAAGTHYYTVQAFSPNGYQANPVFWVNSAESAEVSATIAAPGNVTISWTAVPGATIYRIYHADASGVRNKYAESVTNSYVDDGSPMTTSTPGGPTLHTLKNIFEIKAIQNAQIDSNIFQTHWKGSGQGYAWWIKSVNQDGNAPYIQSKNIVIEHNLLRHCSGWMNIHGREHLSVLDTGPLSNVTIRHNLVYDSSPFWVGGDMYATAISEGVVNLKIDHNTVVHTTSGFFGGLIQCDSAQQTPLVNFQMTNNLLRLELSGIKAGGFAAGIASLQAVAPGYTLDRNGFAGGTSAAYGAGNFYETAASWQSQFVFYGTLDGLVDFHLIPASPHKGQGIDGFDLGADIDALTLAVTGVDTGAAEIPGGPTALVIDARVAYVHLVGGHVFSR